MKCPACSQEMKFFKDYDRKLDGYRCVCGTEKITVAHSISPDINDEDDIFCQYDLIGSKSPSVARK